MFLNPQLTFHVKLIRIFKAICTHNPKIHWKMFHAFLETKPRPAILLDGFLKKSINP